MRRSALLWVAALALAGCGGNGAEPEAERPTGTAAGTATENRPERTPQSVPPGNVPPKTAPAAPPPPTRRELARRAVTAELAQRRLFVGFHDDPSFRWQPHRGEMLRAARVAGATLIRTTVDWAQVAPEQPSDADDPFDPAYRFEGVDELVRSAQLEGIEVLLTIWGTPEWANGGIGPNRAPRRLRDLTAFAHALAARYSGRNPGYPFVRFFSVWNEPNLEQFLAPQFDAEGRSVAPALYAKLHAAAYAGIKRGSPDAFVAAGETSPRGRDRPSDANVQDSHAPATFTRLVAEAAPGLRFDAWAHHPYPTALRRPPTQVARWPNVALVQVPRLGKALDRWFGRRDTPIWLTEYAYQTRPHDANGVTTLQQGAFAQEALRIAAGMPRVEMFVWFTFRDDPGNPWQSGLVDAGGAKKESYGRFAAAARPLDARIEVVALRPAEAVLRMGVREFERGTSPGGPVGVTYHLAEGRRLLADAQPRVELEPDGWITVRVPFRPAAGGRYRIVVVANDRHGKVVRRELVLVGR